jgi:hypothetical protein
MGISLPVLKTPNLWGGASLLAELKRDVDAVAGSWYYDHQEDTGSVLGAYNSALATGRDVVINGDFASDTIWVKGDAAITIGGGTASWSGAQAGNADLTQSGIVANGRTWEVVFTVSGRTAGTITPICGTQAGTARSTDDTFTETITANGADLIFRGDVDFDGNIDNVTVKQTGILANDSNLDGTHTGVTVGQSASGALGLAVLHDGATSYSDISGAEINSMLDPATFTLLIFGKVSAAGVWADGVNRYLLDLRADGANRIFIIKTTINNQVGVYYRAGNINKNVVSTALNGTTDWFMLAMTVDVGADALIAYINDAKVGNTQTGLGTWVGNLSATYSILGALDTTPNNVWDGYICHVAYFPEAKSAAWIAEKARLAGVA